MSDPIRDTDPPGDQPQESDSIFTPLALEEEGLFARDFDGQLVRMVETTADDYDTDVSLTIDGHPVTVKKAVPLKDSQGNIVNDAEGITVPRRTTIYDAASQLFAQQPDQDNPIPILCHREHMQPAGVCRVCVVELFRTVDGKRRGAGTLAPACHQQVEEGMEVQTIESKNDPPSGERVRASVKMLTELLVAEHLNGSVDGDDPPQGSAAGPSKMPNELAKLAKQLGIEKPRFKPRTHERGEDHSSLQIAVDHNSCILCDRCVRACSEIKENYVIGRTGKGYQTRIGFDLDNPMGESSCVSCGECMISCPTDALMFRQEVQPTRAAGKNESPVTAEELLELPMFAGAPLKFLQWNSSSVVKQRLKAGEVLCEEGEYGREAFLLLSGEFDVTNQAMVGHEVKQASGSAWGWFGRVTNKLVGHDPGEDDTAAFTTPGYAGRRAVRLTPEDVIIGEMTCMNHYPRSATVTAATDAEVLRINRNVLYMLQRNESARRILDDVYRKRVLNSQLESIGMLAALEPDERKECVAYLREVAELSRVDPGQTIFRQGESADHFYMVRLGFVKVVQDHGGQQRVLSYLGPGSHFGEIGVLSALTDDIAGQLPVGLTGRRTATCRALDDVELVRIRDEHFRELWRRFPSIRDSIVEYAKDRLAEEKVDQAVVSTPLPEFLDQGLFNAQKLLVLDLEACTRCDECTKACSDTHEGVTRLVREGLRFDKWLVAGSCRSCLDPYCLVGCPVDAIHREGSMEIKIEDHCIGCGLCAQNCPYGNINMHGFPVNLADPAKPGKTRAVVQQRATTCDLCRDLVTADQDPSCVYACPHDAAFRMSGSELLDRVTKSD